MPSKALKPVENTEKAIILNWNRICRICISNESVLYSIETIDEYYNMTFYKMINLCTTLDVSPEDGLPHFICVICINQLYTALDFKEKCQYSEDMLNRLQPKIKDFHYKIEQEDIDDIHPKNSVELESHNNVKFDDERNNHSIEDSYNDYDLMNNVNAQSDVSGSEKEQQDIRIDDEENAIGKDDRYSCPLCQSEFNTLRECKTHKKTHSNTCWKCIATFNSNEEYKEHCIIHKGISCKDCGKYFRKRFLLEKHMVKHTKVKNFLCMVCGKKYCSLSALQVHDRIHSGETRYECKYCGKKFIHWNSKRCHVQSFHTKVKPFECKLCNKHFSLKQHLMSHVRTHTGEKSHSCTICDMKFRHRHTLKIHMFKHTGERPVTCNICNKGFIKNSHLKVHMGTHTGEKNYDCDICNKRFSQAHSLRSHMNIHDTESSIPLLESV